jgi:hypothetical protein
MSTLNEHLIFDVFGFVRNHASRLSLNQQTQWQRKLSPYRYCQGPPAGVTNPATNKLALDTLPSWQDGLHPAN